MKCGSVDSFQVTRCGLSPNARSARSPTATSRWLGHQPSRSVPVPVTRDSSNVSTITDSTCSPVIFRDSPGRGSSVTSSSRSATNRDRHFNTVSRASPNSATISVFDHPRSRPNDPRTLHQRLWADSPRRAHCVNVTPRFRSTPQQQVSDLASSTIPFRNLRLGTLVWFG
jgi:hypothetical protein